MSVRGSCSQQSTCAVVVFSVVRAFSSEVFWFSEDTEPRELGDNFQNVGVSRVTLGSDTGAGRMNKIFMVTGTARHTCPRSHRLASPAGRLPCCPHTPASVRVRLKCLRGLYCHRAEWPLRWGAQTVGGCVRSLERLGWVVTVPDSGCHPGALGQASAGWAVWSPAQDARAVLVNEPLVVGPQFVHVGQVRTLGVQVELAALREGQ